MGKCKKPSCICCEIFAKTLENIVNVTLFLAASTELRVSQLHLVS